MEIEKINGRTPEQIRFNVMECAHGNCLSECPYDSSDECTEDLLGDAFALIRHLEAKVPKWISVEERLPEAFIGVIVQMPGEKPHPTVREGYISNDGVWVAGYYTRDPGEVTHWMMMPEPLKEE